MELKSYKINVGGTTVALRLTLGGQKNLQQRHGDDPMSVIFAALSNPVAMSDLLQECLKWPGSKNPVINEEDPSLDGEMLYNLLVDEGYSGQEKWVDLVANIAQVSGLISFKQAALMRQKAHNAAEEILAGEDDSAENPTMAPAENH